MNFELIEVQINDLLVKYKEAQEKNILNEIKNLFKYSLEENPNNTSALIKLALFEYFYLRDDYEVLDVLRKVLCFEQNNINALILMAYISFSLSYRHEDFILKKLENIQLNNNDLQSMIEYVQALYYFPRDEKLYKKHIKKSVDLCSKYVWNNFKLGKIFLEELNLVEGKKFIEKALENIQYVYIYPSLQKYKILSIDETINELIKGVCITDSNLKYIEETLEKIDD